MERVEHRVLPGPAGGIPARVYHPPGLDAPRPLLLYFHQGGCVIGDLDWCESFCSLLAETARCRVLSVDYRLGPEHRFPAAQDDALAAYAWAAAHAEEIGGDPRRLAVGGDSAGGGLSAMICHEMKRREGPTPVLQLLIYPWVVALADNQSYRDYALGWPLSADGMRWFVAHYLNDDAEREDPRMSPLLEEDFTGLPPAVVATAGFDPLRDEGAAYAEKLQKAGVPVRYRCYETLSHTFTAFGGAVPAARWALEDVVIVSEPYARHHGLDVGEVGQRVGRLPGRETELAHPAPGRFLCSNRMSTPRQPTEQDEPAKNRCRHESRRSAAGGLRVEGAGIAAYQIHGRPGGATPARWP